MEPIVMGYLTRLVQRWLVVLVVVLFGFVLTDRSRAASDVTVSTSTTSGGTFSGTNPRVFTPTATAAVANNGNIQTALNLASSVTINTASAAAGNGDLTVSATVAKTAGGSATLTLNAVRDLAGNRERQTRSQNLRCWS
jgi:hypothetical protein